MQHVVQIALRLIRLEVQLSDVSQRRARLKQPDAVGIGNSERDLIKTGLAFIDNLEITVVVFLVNLETTRGQHPHLLNLLLAVETLRNHDLLM